MRLTILAPQGNLGVDYTLGELLFLLKDGRIYTERDNTVTTIGFEEYVVRLKLSECSNLWIWGRSNRER